MLKRVRNLCEKAVISSYDLTSALSGDISLGAKIRRELAARVLKVLDGEAG